MTGRQKSACSFSPCSGQEHLKDTWCRSILEQHTSACTCHALAGCLHAEQQSHLDQHVIKLLQDQLPHGLAWLLCELIVPKCLPCLCHLKQQQQLLDPNSVVTLTQ